jgi:putative flavoprotein involved in K+ transport
METTKKHDLIIIGGGQSALACAYFLRRKEIDYLILDEQAESGGAWLHAWDSLTLFSPSEYSSLPGWLMPKTENHFPTRNEVIAYLSEYAARYQLPIQRNIKVHDVQREGDEFVLQTSKGIYKSKAIISSTGTWGNPFIPFVKNSDTFLGEQLHSAHYQSPERFVGKKVLIVGEGNSGAQLLAEISKLADTTWAVNKTPEFLPDEVDGRVLFNVASAKYQAMKEGKEFDITKYNLGNIVMVPAVKEARERGVLISRPTFSAFYENGVIWQDGGKENFDVVIWCTGFRCATKYLKNLKISMDEKGKIATKNTQATEIEGLWLVGYGSWTGFASATLIGVGRSARETVEEIDTFLKK